MSPLKSIAIFGNWETLLIPLNGDDTIGFSLLEEQIDLLIFMAMTPKVRWPYKRIATSEVEVVRRHGKWILPEFFESLNSN